MPQFSPFFVLFASLSLLSILSTGVYAEDVVPPMQEKDKHDRKTEASQSVRTEKYSEDAHHFHESIHTEPEQSYFCQAIFPDSNLPMIPTLNAGAKTKALIAYHNYDPSATFVVLLAMGKLMLRDRPDAIVQNFSVVHHSSFVNSSQTLTVDYRFTPDIRLEPGRYRMVLGLFYLNIADNLTSFATAFDGEVTLGDALMTDPRTVLTYFTLIVIGLIVAYGAASRFGLLKIIATQWQKRSQRPQFGKSTETGTVDNSYDPEYISAEHLRVREAMLKRHTTSPPSRRKQQQ